MWTQTEPITLEMYDIVFIFEFNSRFILGGTVESLLFPSLFITIFNFKYRLSFIISGKIDRRDYCVTMMMGQCGKCSSVREQMEVALAYGDLTSKYPENIRIKLITLSGSFVLGTSYSECLSFHALQPEHSIVTFFVEHLMQFLSEVSEKHNRRPLTSGLSYFLPGISTFSKPDSFYYFSQLNFHCLEL